MQTTEVFLTDEQFEQVRANSLKWVEILSGYKTEVGDIIIVQPFIRDANINDVRLVARQVTHVAPSVQSFGGDTTVSFDVCSISETFHTNLP